MKDALLSHPMLGAGILLLLCLGLIGIGAWIARPRRFRATCKKNPLCQLGEGHEGECNRNVGPDQW